MKAVDAVVLNRVSDQEQEQEGYSLDAQEAAAREYVQRKGLHLIREPFVFQETGSKHHERRRFKEVLDFIRAYSGDAPLALVCTRYSRITRNKHDEADIDDLVDAGRLELHLFKESRVVHKNSSPGDRMVTDIDAMVAKHKARETGHAAKEGMVRKAQCGWVTHRAPIGYKHVEVAVTDPTSRRTRERIVVPDEATAPLVRRMFELRAEGGSIDWIRAKLKQEGLIPPGITLHRSTVHTWLRSEFYAGYFTTGGVTYTGKHELIIPPELFRRVQATFEAPPAKQSTKHTKGGVFTGWIRCADPECGCQIVHEHKKGKYDYWRCTNFHKVHPKLDYVREADLFAQFEPALDAITVSDELAKAISKALNETHDRIKRERHATCMRLEKDLTALRKRREDATELYVAKKLAQDDYERLRARYTAEEEVLLKKNREAHEEIDGEYLVLADKILELGKHAKELWNGRSPAERRALLEELLSNPTLEGSTLRYQIKRPFQILSEMASGLDWLGNRPGPRTASRHRNSGIFPHRHLENNGENGLTSREGSNRMGKCPDVDVRS